ACDEGPIRQDRPLVAGGAGSALGGLDHIGRLRENREQVSDHTEVDELEDRRLFVLVDGDDGLRRLHARTVLDGTGDAARDIQLRGYLLAGLADLARVRVPASVDGSAGGSHSSAEAVSELLHLGEVTCC